MGTARCAPPRYTCYADWDRLPVVLTTAQACALLQVCDHTACALITDGLVRGNRVGKQYRFDRDSLRAYITGMEVAP